MLTINKINVTLNEKLILDNLSINFYEGQITCILGKNGSGKSTLLRAIEGLVDSNGEMFLDSTNLKEIKIKDKAKLISYLPQNRPTPNISARLMVEHGRFPYLGFNKTITEDDNLIINKAIDSVGIKDIINKQLNNMSGGEIQKVYIASTLAQESKVILLDEPTNHLDLESQIDILNLVKEIKKDKTIVIVLHDLLQAFSYADYIVILDKGKKVLEGKPSDIYTNKIIKDIYGYSLVKEENPLSLYPYKILK